LTTEITFGFKGKDAQKEIGLKYKSSKVMFVIEGEEYFGKSLAADKLREAVEEIGFRYIDVKKMYKNFKGSLKEQTERIAYTNQYDGLFLIGAKSSDSEKIFSFLFNTENIALAIAQAKEAMQEMAKDHKEKQVSLEDINEQLRVAKIHVDYYLKLYYVDELKVVNELLEKVQIFTSLVEGAIWLQDSQHTIKELRNKKQYNNTQKELIEKFIDINGNLNSIFHFFSFNQNIEKYKARKAKLDQLIPKFQNLIDYNNYLILENKLDILNIDLKNIKSRKYKIDEFYNLTECNCCQGLGVIPKD